MSEVRYKECKYKPHYFEMFLKEAREGKYIGRPSGLGDTLARVAHLTGIDKVARAYERITGLPCDCDKRQKTLNELIPYRAAQGGGPRWAVGVTTAPRQDSTIQTCVASLLVNEWRPFIFAEPDSDLEGLGGLHIVKHEERQGAWHNWLGMCRHLLESDAEWIVTVQDDTLFAGGIRAFLEHDLWPSEKVGMVSLYTPKQYTRTVAGCHRVHTRSLWGACAMLFPRHVMERIVNHRRAATWRGVRFRTRTRPREHWEVANVDTAVGKIVQNLGLEMWFYSPSLSQHIAEYSTLGHGGLGGRRSASWFVGDVDGDVDGGVRIAFSDQPERNRYHLNGTPR